MYDNSNSSVIKLKHGNHIPLKERLAPLLLLIISVSLYLSPRCFIILISFIPLTTCEEGVAKAAWITQGQPVSTGSEEAPEFHPPWPNATLLSSYHLGSLARLVLFPLKKLREMYFT